MSETKKNRWFAKHAKSSAAVVSLAIHATIILVAVFFVVFTAVQKDDQKFEAKQVYRPRQKLKKLQVPVNIKKNTLKPKLRKRIVASNVQRGMPEIEMPEITGVLGGMGGGDGEGGIGMTLRDGTGGIGFTMPEIDFFGAKAKGEKVFIILNASGDMLVDEMGGVLAYDIIKSELIRILEGLNPAVVFNVAVYDDSGKDDYHVLFPNLVPATDPNIAKAQQWIKPLNAYTGGSKKFGAKTLGEGGSSISEEFKVKPLKSATGDWTRPTFLAMKQQADVIFILTCRFGGRIAYTTSQGGSWSPSEKKRWNEVVAKARAKYKEENERREAKGLPPRVFSGHNTTRRMVQAYFPGTRMPPQNKYATYTAGELTSAFDNMRKTWADKNGVEQKKYTLNIIHFVPSDGGKRDDKLSSLASATRGSYSLIKGMEAIQSYVDIEPQN